MKKKSVLPMLRQPLGKPVGEPLGYKFSLRKARRGDVAGSSVASFTLMFYFIVTNLVVDACVS